MIALISWLGVLTISLASAGQVSSHTPRPIWSWSGRIGEAQIIATWCQQKTLTFDITIADGNVSDGRTGDATVKSGKMHWNRSILGNTDYVIAAALEGDIVAAEHIRRKSIKPTTAVIVSRAAFTHRDGTSAASARW
jgi:hypothetical protein